MSEVQIGDMASSYKVGQYTIARKRASSKHCIVRLSKFVQGFRTNIAVSMNLVESIITILGSFHSTRYLTTMKMIIKA